MKTLGDAVSDDVAQAIYLCDVVKQDEMLADRGAGDRFQLVSMYFRSDADNDHLYIGVTSPCSSLNCLVRHARLTVGQQNPNARVTVGDFSSTVELRKAVNNQLVDCQVRVSIVCRWLEFDVVRCLQYFVFGCVIVQVKLSFDFRTADKTKHRTLCAIFPRYTLYRHHMDNSFNSSTRLKQKTKQLR